MMNSLHLATSTLDDLTSSSSPSSSSAPSPRNETEQLLIGYQRLLELAEKVSSTLLIRHNDWILQIKGLRQHYLFENDEALMEMKTTAKSALEIGRREKERNAITPLYTISFSDEKGFVVKSEQAGGKTIKVPVGDNAFLPKIMAFLK